MATFADELRSWGEGTLEWHGPLREIRQACDIIDAATNLAAAFYPVSGRPGRFGWYEDDLHALVAKLKAVLPDGDP
jgi:hypothetical protein